MPPKHPTLARIVRSAGFLTLVLAKAVLGVDGPAPGPQTASLPLLTRIADVRNLSPDEAALEYPVHVQGVVTYNIKLKGVRGFFLQDESAGIWIWTGTNEAAMELDSGQRIELGGTSHPGQFAPMIKIADYKVIGPGPLPEARNFTFKQLSTGVHDAQFGSVEGVVRTITLDAEDRLRIQLEMEGGRLQVRGPRSDGSITNHHRFIGATVRLQGVAATKFNESRQFLAPHLFIDALADTNVLRPGPGSPFALPVTPICNVVNFNPGLAAGLPLKIQGTATYFRPGMLLVLRDRTQSIVVEISDYLPIAPGDVVEAAGFPAAGPFNPVLQDALYRKITTGDQVKPVPTTVETLLTGKYDGELVTVDAEFLNEFNGPNEIVLMLKQGDVIFNASVLHIKDEVPFSIRKGSQLRLNGICRVQEVATSRSLFWPTAIRLLLSDARDIAVLSQPSWWTPARLVVLLASCFFLIVLVLAWAWTLSRRIKRQVEIIRAKIELASTLEERVRIARELHDSLEQELAGVSIQLDVLADKAREPYVRDSLTLIQRLIRRLQAEARNAVWDLRSLRQPNDSLSAALLEWAEKTRQECAVDIQVQMAGDGSRRHGVNGHHLLRICQESVTNAITHGRASKILVAIQTRPEGLTVEITDNGCGFEPSEVSRLPERGHFGLLGIKERVQKMGGRLALESRPGCGTKLTVVVSLAALAKPPETGQRAVLNDEDQLLKD